MKPKNKFRATHTWRDLTWSVKSPTRIGAILSLKLKVGGPLQDSEIQIEEIKSKRQPKRTK
jgi:hypothetical protein